MSLNPNRLDLHIPFCDPHFLSQKSMSATFFSVVLPWWFFKYKWKPFLSPSTVYHGQVRSFSLWSRSVKHLVPTTLRAEFWGVKHHWGRGKSLWLFRRVTIPRKIVQTEQYSTCFLKVSPFVHVSATNEFGAEFCLGEVSKKNFAIFFRRVTFSRVTNHRHLTNESCCGAEMIWAIIKSGCFRRGRILAVFRKRRWHQVPIIGPDNRRPSLNFSGACVTNKMVTRRKDLVARLNNYVLL